MVQGAGRGGDRRQLMGGRASQLRKENTRNCFPTYHYCQNTNEDENKNENEDENENEDKNKDENKSEIEKKDKNKDENKDKH